MWIMLSDSFLSIVQKPDQPDGTLTVRAREIHDITRVFPNADPESTPGGDYAYRAVVPRREVALALSDEVMNIGYSNFKATVREPDRHAAYLMVWRAMYRFQEGRTTPKRGSARVGGPRGHPTVPRKHSAP